jgi:glyoxylase I family protein
MKDVIKSIHHVAIIVSDIAQAKEFYIDILGGELIAENFRSDRKSWKVDISLGGSQIELFTFPNAAPRPSRPEAQGLRHLAFLVASVDDMQKQLQARRIQTEEIRIDPYTQQRFFFIADPDDLPIEFYETTN